MKDGPQNTTSGFQRIQVGSELMYQYLQFLERIAELGTYTQKK